MNSFELPWDRRTSTSNIMHETEKLEVPDKLLYNPTLENEFLPIVGNFTVFPLLCNSNSFYFRTMNSFELPWDWRTSTSNIIPRKERLEVPDRIVYNPTLKNKCNLQLSRFVSYTCRCSCPGRNF